LGEGSIRYPCGSGGTGGEEVEATSKPHSAVCGAGVALRSGAGGLRFGV
jgi:hypothetical protein